MRIFTRRRLLATPALLLSAISTVSAAEEIKRPKATAEVWARTELYFGTNRANVEPVTEAEFAGFIDLHVTPKFPDGLTLLTGNGQFKTSAGVLIREKSHVLILLYPPQMQDANAKIQEIREAYKAAFSQESVLRVDSFSFVSF
ncbi:MAG TPA: DUF3574 domain-containing protein [Bryobacteraceae bacterium]|nr:DUF3574 domain-containing protein [Bryobacteraceae bacterium]